MQTDYKILLLDGNGAAKKATLTEAKDYNGFIWIRVSPYKINALFKKISFNYSPLVSDFLSAEETRPRALFHDNSLLATYRGVNLNQGQDPEDMVSVRLWIKSNLIVTVQRRKLTSADEIEESLLAGMGPKTSAEFIEMLLEGLTSKSAEIVSTISDQLDLIEEFDVPRKQQQENYDELSILRRRIILLYRYIHPQNEAIITLSANKLTWLTPENLSNLKEVSNINRIILENLQAERERAKVIHEEFEALDQKLLNTKMYLIAVITAIFMPLTFITGLFGVNLGGIPGETANYAFLLLVAVLVFIGVTQVIHLKRRGWL